MKDPVEKVAWIILSLTVIGLVITEYHFFERDIDATQYVELVTFLYGGGVLGKILPIVVGLWIDRKKPA